MALVLKRESVMRKNRAVWIAAIGSLVLGAALPALAKGAKPAPLAVTYYYLPG
jgi:hypothetical protein